MMRSASAVTVVLVATAMLAGCAGTPETPSDVDETSTASPVETAATAELADLDGEWVLTRTVTEGNDSSEVYGVGFTEERFVAFATEDCADTCVGTVLSGATLDGRSQTQFEQSDSVINFTFSGFNDCLDLATGRLLVPNGYEYELEYQLVVDAVGDSAAESLSGTALNVYTPTPDAIAAGCETDTGRISYEVTATRG